MTTMKIMFSSDSACHPNQLPDLSIILPELVNIPWKFHFDIVGYQIVNILAFYEISHEHFAKILAKIFAMIYLLRYYKS